MTSIMTLLNECIYTHPFNNTTKNQNNLKIK